MNAMKIYARQFNSPLLQTFFLFGPRGVGKSKFLKIHFPNAHFIDLLNDRTLTQYMNDPDRIESVVSSMNNKSVVVVDEIQKVPKLLSIIHRLIESEELPQIQFILTGSSSRKLKAAGVDLLAGRATIKRLFPFIASELGDDFSLTKALKFGLVPLVWNSQNPEDTLSAYIALYLKEEVKQEGLVRSVESFSRFLEVMCYSHAEIINLSNVSREAQVKRSTIDSFLSILEDLLLGYRIQIFKIKNRKQTVESEKFYYFDVGVFKSLCPDGLLESQTQFKGQALEGLVAQHLLAVTSYRNKKENVYFWRTQSGVEVDFIIYGPSTLLALEVKSTNDVKIEHLKGLKSFSEDYPKAKKIFLYLGKEERTIKGIRCIPVEFFLKNIEKFL